MALTTRTFEVRAIDPAVASGLRQLDDLGRRPRPVVDEHGGSPLRCCLRLSQPGERIALVSYAPLRRWANEHDVDAGAYDEVGPIFIHADRCAGPVGDGYPSELRDSRRMLRAYSDDGRIMRGVVVDANGQFEDALDELLADARAAVVHARAFEFGCFTFEVRRR